MLFLLINLLIILSYYLLVTRVSIERLSGKFVCVFLLSAAQIILTITLLGHIQRLYLSYLVVLNVTLAAGVSWLSICGYKDDLSLSIRQDWRVFRLGVKAIVSPENIFMILLMLFVSVWFCLAAHLLPPRGVDAQVYHLPEIYEYIQNHGFKQLPIEVREHFAFPQNAEMLFLWPIIFWHSSEPIGLVQYTVALWGVIAIFALGRFIHINKRLSFFVAVQFLFAPVVLAQAGSAYIDIIVSVFYLMSLYAAVEFYRNQRSFFLYVAALGMGLMLGMKYSAFIFIAALQVFILPAFIKNWYGRRKDIFIYLSIMAVCGGSWYIRNYIHFGNPAYPVNLFSKDIGIFIGNDISSIREQSFHFWHKLTGLFSKDYGLGSLHGGYGITFWGIALPAGIIGIIKSMVQIRNKNYFPFLFWSQLMVGFGVLFIVPYDQFNLYPRCSIFMIAIGFLAMGRMLVLFNQRPWYKLIIIVLCCLSALLSVMRLSLNRNPTYEVDMPLRDIASGRMLSENKYLNLSSYILKLTMVWEALDFLTREDEVGLDVYLSMNRDDFWTAPVYGQRIQNRIWNYQDGISSDPDAVIIYGTGESDVYHREKRFELGEVFYNSDYEIIVNTSHSLLFVHKQYIDQKSKSERLAEFYKNYNGPEITTIGAIVQGLDSDIPIVTGLVYGYAMKYFKLAGKINNSVFLTPVDWEGRLVRQRGWAEVYTLGKPLRGYGYEEVAVLELDSNKIILYKNIKG